MKDTSIILIVDDEIVSRYTVEVLLESEGYQLIFAESGEEALLKAEQYMPDLMLLDVMMPDMDGFQVCQLLRANPRLAELPIVMVTALDDRESKLRGIEVGADDFMSKPFDRAELRARVRTITRLNRYRRLLETEEHLVYLANYDLLTRLPNRSLLIERLRQAISRANRHQQSLAILVIDLDGFQIINDSLGHEFGDQLLSEMASRLTELVPQGTTVARLGSDDFALMYESKSLVNDVSNLIQNLLNVISKPIVMNEHEIVMTASIGVSVYPSDGEEALVLLKNANAAMSRAKLEGQNSYKFFTEEMNKLALERLILENHLRKALSRDELRLFYQPQIDLKTHRIIGVEALLRWQHPELGLVSPDRFIPVAEETSMIITIGEWVLHTACAQCKQWQEQGLSPIRVAVNVSSRQFQNSDLFTTIENALTETQLMPHYLELEITESMLMEDDLTQKNSSFSMFSELQKKGIHIAVDDFGTGYSSLSYLKRFPLNTLKIDRSFIKDVCSNPDDAAITTAIIAMAHSLQLSVVAEGVEEETQLDFLRQHACETAQGFLFSRAVPACEIEQLLKNFNH
jgi:diguanylate cyclase